MILMITIKKPIVILSIILLYLVPSQILAEGAISELEQTIKRIKPFKASFTQVYFDAFQDKTITSKGSLTFMQPGLMKWEYSEPEEMLFIVGKIFAWLYDPVLENVTVQQLDNISGIKSMRFLSKDEPISKHFTLTAPDRKLIDAPEQRSVLYLKPINENPSLAELQIVYDAENAEIHQFVIIDHNTNFRKVTFHNITYDSKIRESDFEFTVTEDMEVIQGIAN